MKTILIGLAIGTFAFAGGASAAVVGKGVLQGSLWGFIPATDTMIYKVGDKTGTCYVAERGTSIVMDCVK